MLMEFYKDNYSIILNKENNESYEMFYQRGKFIIHQNNPNFDELVKLSKVYVNIKFRNCIYPDKLVNKIKQMEKNILT